MASSGEPTYIPADVQEGQRRVLFINSPTSIGADTAIHFLLLKYLPREALEVHAAGQPSRFGEGPSPAFEALQAMPELALKSTYFGPSLYGLGRTEKLARALRLVPAAASLVDLARYVRAHRIQILHATDRPRDAVACAALARVTGAKAVIHVHVKYDNWMSRGVKWALGRADRLVGVSEFVAESLRNAGYPRERIVAIPNAIEIERWDPSLSPAPGRQSLGVAQGTPLIVSVARLFYWKGHKELIEALALVKRDEPGVRLCIVGADYPEGSGVTQSLRELARGLGIEEDVLFVGQRSDIPALLAACDVFALPSFEEPFGLVFAEAMAMKRPVAALSNGGTPEVVEHERSGLLSAPGDVPGLARNLLRLVRDPQLRARMGEEGRARVEARFGAPRLAQDFVDLYAQLAEA